MDKIIEAILKLIPISKYLELIGVNKESAAALTVIVATIVIYILVGYLKKWYDFSQATKASKDLSPYYDYLKVKKSVQYYIPTYGQNFSPTHEEDPSASNKFIVKKNLISWFLKTAFNEKKESDKFYLILADSGMGKTTFMINLYLRYNSVFNRNRKYKIKLLPFSDDRILDNLKDISKKREEVRDTILLLDAFDEYKGVFPPEYPDGLTDEERFRKRLDEIFEITRDFREVVITSRTQYFPGQENQPYELKIPSFDEKGFHVLSKLYLSPFSEKEINCYLNKKFGFLKFWNRKKKRIAKGIVNDSPKLMVRPMLLSYIDYLVDENVSYKNTFDIYETLIYKWIEREANKRKYEAKNRAQFKRDLYNFSKLISLEIYNNRKHSGSLSINKQQALDLCNTNSINLKYYEITGQSLLTRDINNNWKFAHKSILEFFLAKNACENISFLINLDLTGFDMTKQFCFDLGLSSIILSNFEFIKGSQKTIEPTEYYKKHVFELSDYHIGKFLVSSSLYNVITKSIIEDNEFDKSNASLTWLCAIDFCNKINKQFGYNNNYDDDGNLVDKDGNITYDITKVKGFRLPTSAEIVSLSKSDFLTEVHKNYYKNLVNDERLKFLSILCYDVYSEDFYLQFENVSNILNPIDFGTNNPEKQKDTVRYYVFGDGCCVRFESFSPIGDSLLLVFVK